MDQYQGSKPAISLLERQYIFDDIGYVELWDFSRSNRSIENIIDTVTTVANVCHGDKGVQNPERLYEFLKTEASGLPSSALEFVRFGPRFDIDTSLRHHLEHVSDNYIEHCNTMNIPERIMNNVITLRMKLPIFSIRQLIRQRQCSYMELSRRYTSNITVPFEYFISRVFTDKQILLVKQTHAIAEAMYNFLCVEGVKPEVAREVLPLSTYTTIWMQMTRDWFNYWLRIRHTVKTQQDSTYLFVDIAKSLAEKHQPNIVED